MESLQLSQVLADLSNLGAAERESSSAIVHANIPVIKTELVKPDLPSSAASSQQQKQQQQQQQGNRPSSALRRAWSSETSGQPRFDKMGRRILISTPIAGSASNSIPGTPQALTLEEDMERANTLMALYDIRSKLKQQDNSSLLRAREKINALAARQQAQQAAEQNRRTAEEARRNRYSFPKSGL